MLQHLHPLKQTQEKNIMQTIQMNRESVASFFETDPEFHTSTIIDSARLALGIPHEPFWREGVSTTDIANVQTALGLTSSQLLDFRLGTIPADHGAGAFKNREDWVRWLRNLP